jgi:hypothetical protein
MGKQQTKLDRKTRRAIAHAISSQVKSGSTGGNGRTVHKRVSTPTTLNVSSQNLTGGWATKASSGSSIKGGIKTLPTLRDLPPITGALFVSHHTGDNLHWHLRVAEKLLAGIEWTFVCRTTKEHEV